MTSSYSAYLEAVATLHEQSDRLSTELAAAEAAGQTDLDAEARRVREAQDAGRDALLRLRTVNDQLARLARDVRFDLEPAPSNMRPAASLVEAERRIADLQRELTAIEGNCDWLRRNRSAVSQVASPSIVPPSVAAVAPTVVAAPVAAAPPTRPVWQNPIVWIAVALAVILVLVVLLIVK